MEQYISLKKKVYKLKSVCKTNVLYLLIRGLMFYLYWFMKHNSFFLSVNISKNFKITNGPKYRLGRNLKTNVGI